MNNANINVLCIVTLKLYNDNIQTYMPCDKYASSISYRKHTYLIFLSITATLRNIFHS